MKSSSDFDIGQFLNSYDSLKGQFNGISEVVQATDVLRRWEIPSVSILCCVFVMTLCISFPEFLFAFCLSPIPLVLLITYIKLLGQEPSKRPFRHIIVVTVESEGETLKRKQEIVERSRKDMRRFLKVWYEQLHLCNKFRPTQEEQNSSSQLEETSQRISKLQSFITKCRRMRIIWPREVCEFSAFQRKNDHFRLKRLLFLWEDPQLTIRFLAYVFGLMVLFTIMPLSFLFLASFLYIFLNNPEFWEVVTRKLCIEIPSVKSRLFNEDDIEEFLEWHDACSDVESNLSSSDDVSIGSSSDEGTEEYHASQNAGRRSKSLMSNISAYRKRRKEFKKGTCVACDVAFSSLLTRRRYCRRCGDKFCSKCCRHYVKKAALGATAPGSRDRRVLVCNNCYGKLRFTTKAPD